MPIDPTVMAEARALVVKAGMADFVPVGSSPASTGGMPVAIALIDPPKRVTGIPNFDTNQPGSPRRGAQRQHLDGLARGSVASAAVAVPTQGRTAV